MNVGVDPATVVHHWPLDAVVSWTTLHHKGTVWLLTTASGAEFVLKEMPTATARGPQALRLGSEYGVLLHLERCGVPVAVPVLSHHGQPYVAHEGRLYTLSPSLVPRASAARAAQDAAERDREVYARIGAALSTLHRALATYPQEIDSSWRMRLPHHILDRAAPRVAGYLSADERARFLHRMAALTPGWERAFAGLPEQHIHGDCHMGNIILGDAGVAGFVDLDHLPVGPRIYDLGYVLADMVKWRITDAHETARWLALAPSLIAGYAQESPLSAREYASLWSVLLVVQLLFAEHYVAAQDEAGVRLNLAAFDWFVEHSDESGRHFMGAHNPTL